MRNLLLIIALLPVLVYSQETVLLRKNYEAQKEYLKIELVNSELKTAQQVFTGIAVAWVATAIITKNDNFYLNAGVWGGLAFGTSIAINTRRKRGLRMFLSAPPRFSE